MIERIQLENFKDFGRLTLPLGSLTLLSGLNSSGKSSVLQAIAMLRQSALAGVGNEALMLNGSVVELGMGTDVLNERSSEDQIGVGLGEEGADVWWRAEVSPTADVLPLVAPPGQLSLGIDNIVHGDGLQYLRADRVAPAVVYAKSHELAVRRRSLGSRGEYAVHFLSVHQDEHVVSSELIKHGAPRLLTQVTSWMNEISPGVRIEVADLKGTDFVQVRFGFGRKAGLAGSRAYRATHVGFGLMYTLPVVIACLGTAPGGLFVVENPEAHVHPKGQAALGELFARAAAGGLQVIVESHSDHVLNGIRVAVKKGLIRSDSVWIHFFARAHDNKEIEIVSPTIAQDGHLSVWPEEFFDQWDRSLDDLLDV